MGWGDVLMSMGEARALYRRSKQPVMIVGRDGRPIKSDLFDGIPYIIQKPLKSGPFHRIVNGPGVRPYIAGKTDERWSWRLYKPEPAEIKFTDAELAFAEKYRGMVMVEPNVKAIGHDNKAWSAINWQQLDSAVWSAGLRLGRLVQCGPSSSHWLLHATKVPTDTFRQALAVMSVCRAFIGTEGGLMHGAAAVGTPAVIIWTEFISPEITGYPQHKNLRAPGKPCGSRKPCDSCRRSAMSITPSMVLEALKEILT
jgi:ADP-heptose:LPS heptosyltransferase